MLVVSEFRHQERRWTTPPWTVKMKHIPFPAYGRRLPPMLNEVHRYSTNSSRSANPVLPVFKWPTRVLPSDLVSLIPQGLASIHLQLRTDTGNSWMVSADVTSCVSVSSGLSRNSLAPHHPRNGYSLWAARTNSDECTGLFKMIVEVLTTFHTQYTWDRSISLYRWIEKFSKFSFMMCGVQ